MQNFLDTYSNLNSTNLQLLSSIYTDDIVFTDPAHSITGIDDLTLYFEALYNNINCISFDFEHRLQNGNTAYLQWKMTFSHPRLARGRSITVPGMSFLQFAQSGKVFHHRDQFDLGCMLYEHLPVIGSLIISFKRRFGK